MRFKWWPSSGDGNPVTSYIGSSDNKLTHTHTNAHPYIWFNGLRSSSIVMRTLDSLFFFGSTSYVRSSHAYIVQLHTHTHTQEYIYFLVGIPKAWFRLCRTSGRRITCPHPQPITHRKRLNVHWGVENMLACDRATSDSLLDADIMALIWWCFKTVINCPSKR